MPPNFKEQAHVLTASVKSSSALLAETALAQTVTAHRTGTYALLRGNGYVDRRRAFEEFM